MKNKIFGIGFHKTGTKSLAKALEILGYKVTGPNWTQEPQIATLVKQLSIDLLDDFDAFQDNPWPLLYKEMDSLVPNSKFILTLRPEDEWITSVVSHFGKNSTQMREWIYGVGFPIGHENTYISRYKQHNQSVQEYFRSRPNDLLVLKITEGEGWKKLCGFLNKPVPSMNFPFENQTTYLKRPLSDEQ